MSRPANPFDRRTLIGLVLGGTAIFVLLLYAIGAGWNGQRDGDGGAHAAANGLNGFSALAQLLERRGHQVDLSRSAGRLDEEALLILTPSLFTDGAELWETIAARRYVGPTLVILPKWLAVPVPEGRMVQAEPGWVSLGAAIAPGWTADMPGLASLEPEIAEHRGWRGLGLSGSLPVPDQAQAMAGAGLIPLVSTPSGAMLAGYRADSAYYPVLAEAAGREPFDPENPGVEEGAWPLVIVAEPDLMNNYGLADQDRAMLAMALIEATLEDYDLPILFDLTLPGLGQSDNLLTLAFRPPFLAATLCLLLAALAVGWRAFHRFGPPVAEAPELANGKRQLARNAGGLVERARRLHLLGPPFAALLAARIARLLGIRETEPEARDQAIARVLAARGRGDLDYRETARALRDARRPAELLRAASALKTIERTLTP